MLGLINIKHTNKKTYLIFGGLLLILVIFFITRYVYNFHDNNKTSTNQTNIVQTQNNNQQYQQQSNIQIDKQTQAYNTTNTTPTNTTTYNKTSTNNTTTYKENEAYFDKLFKTGKIVYDDPQKPRAAIVILDPSQVNPNIKIIENSSFVIKHLENDVLATLVVCQNATGVYQDMINVFLNKSNNYSHIAKYFFDLFSEQTPGFDKSYEYGTFAFIYQNQICFPYPLLMKGGHTDIVDPRETAAWNWNISGYDQHFKPIYKTEFLFSMHNHPMDYGFTEYASADDFVRPFFAHKFNGLMVVGKYGLHIIRVKDKTAYENLRQKDYHDFLWNKIAELREQYKAIDPDYPRLQEYREKQRELIFNIPEMNQAFEEIYIKK